MDLGTKTEESSTGVPVPPPSLGLLASKSVAWVGASAGALTLVCHIFGFLVEHAWLDRLGIPRTVYESQPSEYIVTGAKFLAGVIPLAATGALLFVVEYWWMLAVLILSGLAAWKLRLTPEARLLVAAVLYVLWMVAMLLRFERASGVHDHNGLAIFSFGTVVGVLYCYAEVYLAAKNPRQRPLSRWLSRIPLFGLVFCAIFALPYLKGIHGTERPLPFIEFLGKDQPFFCELAGQPVRSDCGSWQLIELGKERTLLWRPADASIYVVPTNSITTFRLVKGPAPK